MKLMDTLCVAIIVVMMFALLTGAALKCEHTEICTQFSFQPQNSTAYNHAEICCEECGRSFDRVLFRGVPSDYSHLKAIADNSDAPAMVAGKYCTVSAIVTCGDYDTNKSRIRCEIKNNGVVVNFSVEFREEFEKYVKSLSDGDKIQLRGKLYDTGFGFTDSELL
jgi:DNA-directed RNA polymerase subunit RPC12/RpoP